VELRVDWTVEPLTIEGSALPFGLTIDNHNGYLQWVILRARITQGTASRDAGELEPDCGGTPGDVESGVCSFTMPLAASNAVPGSGTLVPGPATVQLDLQLYEGSGGTGELIEVLDTAQFSTTLVAPP
jgi:hypothetical protein